VSRLRTVFIVAANAALLMLVLELVSHRVILAHQAAALVRSYATIAPAVRDNYAPKTPAEIDELLRDAFTSRWRYEPTVGFVTAPQRSRFVNVNASGIRSNGTPAAPLDGAIWFMGGSTTFGFGVADNETIPAALEARLGRPVLNLGVAGHSSLHENRLLSHYLRVGLRPSTVVFLNGVNEICDVDLAEEELAGLVALYQRGYMWQPSRPVVLAGRLGITKAARMLGMIGDEPAGRSGLSCQAAGRELPLKDVIARSLAERAMLCRLYGLDCRTYIQPVAGVHGRHDVVADNRSVPSDLVAKYHHLEPVWRRAEVRFVTGALDMLDRHAYIDEVHYSAAAHQLIAAAIAATLPARPEPHP
jgi:hypothetical protein